ncbi:YopX family protein [Bacillus altitudinis]|uniref:YopX family protein n=1 Tax=Bacillus altitudinis TaxID=293387 RepID=UPI001C38B576|nr:YopX family protein [Bacillus altitudinis]MBV5114571.1 YopX family protein [Bacillus altitudinis]MBW2730247.1 YopX family protein [Bacillus altitudinis]
MDFVIRYVFKHRATGNIEIKIYSISQLEARAAQKLSPCFDETEYEMIARNLFTGLKDKNGFEIYEGDVVQGSPRYQRADEIILIEQMVSFLNGCFMFGNWNAHEYFNKHQHIEVVGNIYQNPDLLEEAR